MNTFDFLGLYGLIAGLFFFFIVLAIVIHKIGKYTLKKIEEKKNE